jgi:hypothetical protein
MTLVLSLITPTFVAQVSDRLVARDTLPFDQYTNTNVVYFAADGIMSLGYPGPAYREKHKATTDDWIAGVLADDPEPGALRVPGAFFQKAEAVQ